MITTKTIYMKVLLFMLLALFYGGLALAQGEDPTETRVKAWLKEKRTAFYASRAKDPAVQNFLLLYEQLEKDGRICRQTVSPGLKLEAIRTNEETVRVNWYATTATNVEGYILERSLGNNAPFEQVHYIKADPSITTQAFQFNDNNSYAEKSIYRVVQVFLSGERLEKKSGSRRIQY